MLGLDAVKVPKSGCYLIIPIQFFHQALVHYFSVIPERSGRHSTVGGNLDSSAIVLPSIRFYSATDEK